MRDVFISYNWHDRPAATRIAEAMKDRGLDPFFDQWSMIPGKRWQGELKNALDDYRAAAICFGRHGLGNWQRLELEIALNRQVRDGDSFPVIPVLLPGIDMDKLPLGFLELNTWVDLRDEREQDFDLLAAAVRGERPEALARAVADAKAAVNPYRGLSFFREEDAHFFHGREDVTKRLCNLVEKHRFVAVVGASGSGKSSVVRAGLIPQLRSPESGVVWNVVTVNPGSDPAMNLAERLAPMLEPDLTEAQRDQEVVAVANRLNATDDRDRGALGRLIRRLIEKFPGIDRVLLLIDQFEELFTLSDDPEARDRFLAELMTAIRAEDVPLTIVVTLRADYYHRITDSDDEFFSDAFSAGQLNVGRMARDDLGRAIEQPAKMVGLDFEEGLVQRILDDVSEEEGALPLLEYLLEALWRTRRPESRLFTHQDYDTLGGVKHAIAERAGAVYEALEPDEKVIARDVLLRLVRPGAGTLDSKRPADLTDLGPEIQAVVGTLARERLVVTDEGRIEITHEALIREWDQLRNWVEDAREGLVLRDRLESDALTWHETMESEPSQADDYLIHRRPMLAEARRLLDENTSLLDGFPIIRDYIEASIARDEAAQEAEAAKIRRERRRLRAAAAVFGLLFLGAAAAATWAFFAEQDAVAERKNAETAKAEAEDAASEAKRNFQFALQATDDLALSIARNLEMNFTIAASDKLFIAQRLDANFGKLVKRLGDSQDLRMRHAQLLTSTAFIYYDIGREDLALKNAERANALLTSDKIPAKATTATLVVQARAKIVLATGYVSFMSYNKAKAALDQATKLISEAGSRDDTNTALALTVPRVRIGALRAKILNREMRIVEAEKVRTRTMAIIRSGLTHKESAQNLSQQRALFAEQTKLHQLGFNLSRVLHFGDYDQRLKAMLRDLWRAKSKARLFPSGSDHAWRFYRIQYEVNEGKQKRNQGRSDQALSTMSRAIRKLADLIKNDTHNIAWRRELAYVLRERASLAMAMKKINLAQADLDAARSLAVSIKAESPTPLANIHLDIVLDYENGLFQIKTRDYGAASDSFTRIKARVDLAKESSNEFHSLNDYINFSHYGMARALIAKKSFEAAIGSSEQALKAIQENEKLVGPTPYILSRRIHIYKQILRLTEKTKNTSKWEAIFKNAIADTNALMSALPDAAIWPQFKAQFFHQKAIRLKKDNKMAAAIRHYSMAAKAQQKAAGNEPQNLGSVQNYVFYQRYRLQLQAKIQDWAGVLATAKRMRLVIPKSGKGTHGGAGLALEWERYLKSLTRLVETARKETSTKSDRSVRRSPMRDLEQELKRAKEMSKAIARLVSESSRSRTAAKFQEKKRFDLKNLKLGRFGSFGFRNVKRVRERLSWASRPIYPAPWRTLVGTELDAAIKKYERVGIFRQTRNVPEEQIQRVRKASLPFYADGALLEAEYKDRNGNFRTLSLLLVNGRQYVLNGASPPIHAANKEAPLRLADPEAAVAYMRFFGSYVSGGKGSFHLVDNIDDLAWLPNASDEKRTAVSQILRPVAAWADPKVKGGWRMTAAVQYGDMIFHAAFQVKPTGKVVMHNDILVASKLPIMQITVTNRDFRRDIDKFFFVEDIGDSPIADEIDFLQRQSRLTGTRRPPHYLALATEAVMLQRANEGVAAQKKSTTYKAIKVVSNAATLHFKAAKYERAHRFQADVVERRATHLARQEKRGTVLPSSTKRLANERVQLAHLALLIGNVDEARAQTEKALKLDAGHARAKLQHAHVQMALGKIDDAVAIYRRSAKLKIGKKSWADVANADLKRIRATGHYAEKIAAFRAALDRAQGKSLTGAEK